MLDSHKLMKEQEKLIAKFGRIMMEGGKANG
jgi:hypothetical protein